MKLLDGSEKKMIARWWKKQQQLRALKAEESELRDEVIAMLDVKQSTTIPLSKAANIRVTIGTECVFDAASVEKLPERLRTFAFRFKPSLDAAGFKALSAKDQKRVEKCFYRKPSKPALSVDVKEE